MELDPHVSQYIHQQPAAVAQILTRLRDLIQLHAPNAVESIAYAMPAYKTHGKPLLYFAAFSKHIGVYATPSGHEAFAAKLASYKQGRGSVQFPIDQAFPFGLFEEILLFRIQENAAGFQKAQ
jgi:uncharacterized protein YdhG (YjbR/CyaY superfamily)